MCWEEWSSGKQEVVPGGRCSPRCWRELWFRGWDERRVANIEPCGRLPVPTCGVSKMGDLQTLPWTRWRKNDLGKVMSPLLNAHGERQPLYAHSQAKEHQSQGSRHLKGYWRDAEAQSSLEGPCILFCTQASFLTTVKDSQKTFRQGNWSIKMSHFLLSVMGPRHHLGPFPVWSLSL